MTRWRIDFDLPDERYAELARGQKKHLAELAERIERGAAIGSIDRKVVAAILRHAADGISERQPRKQRQAHARQIDYGSAALLVAMYLHAHGMSQNKAFEKVADLHDVSVTTIKKAWKENGDGAERFVIGDW